MNSYSEMAEISQQGRGERTREAYLKAFEQLLETRDFEQISIQEIAQAAGRSTGGFYTKFTDKEDILKQLLSKYEQERREIRDSSLGDPAWETLDLESAVNRLARVTVQEFRSRRGLFRAHIQRQRTLHASSPQKTESHAALRSLYDLVYEILRPKAPARTEQETRFAFFVLTTVVTGAILFPEDAHAQTLALSDDQLVDFCSDLLLRYLNS